MPDGGLAAIGLSSLNENVPAVDVLLEEVYHAVIGAVDAWAERPNAMEENAGPLAPAHGEYVAHLNWIGEHVIARSPAGETNWREASFKPSRTLVARASRRKTACGPSILRRHPCVPWAHKAPQPPIRLHHPVPQGHHAKQKSPATVMAAGLCKL